MEKDSSRKEEITDQKMTLELKVADDESITCTILTIMTLQNKDYIALLPLDEDEEDGEAMLFRYFKDENDVNAEPKPERIEDEEEYEMVAIAFDEFLTNEGLDGIVF